MGLATDFLRCLPAGQRIEAKYRQYCERKYRSAYAYRETAAFAPGSNERALSVLSLDWQREDHIVWWQQPYSSRDDIKSALRVTSEHGKVVESHDVEKKSGPWDRPRRAKRTLYSLRNKQFDSILRRIVPRPVKGGR